MPTSPATAANTPIIVFCDSIAHPLSAAATSAPILTSIYSSLALQVSGATSISLIVEGCVDCIDEEDAMLDDSDCVWVALACFSVTDLSMSESIIANGIYKIDVTGLSKARVRVASAAGAAIVTGTIR